MRIKFVLFTSAAIIASLAAFTETFSPSASAQTVTSAHILSTEGSLSANGQYTQTTGTFFRMVAGMPLPSPTPTPVASPTPTATPTPGPTPCVPSPGSPGQSFYLGIYTLSNGESGNFVVSAENGMNVAFGSGAPEELPENPITVEEGPLTLALQINVAAGTGTGTVSFTSNGTAKTGTIVIVTKVQLPPVAPVTCGNPTPTPTPTPNPSPTPIASPTPNPTPSGVSISGRVSTPSGMGLRNAVVTLTDSLGVKRSATTSAFGNYRFDGVRSGEPYVIGVNSKRFRFSPQLLAVAGDVSDLELSGLE